MKYAQTPLDFEPGTGTGYSALVGFETLGRLVEIISGETLDEYLRRHIMQPLGIEDLGFEMTEEQNSRMAALYKYEDGRQVSVSEDILWKYVDPRVNGYYSGAAGMIGSLAACDRFVQMLAGEGTWNGVEILKPETVRRMRTERARNNKKLMPGCIWGLGMVQFSDFGQTGRYVGEGTFGWSGAYGTHFYVDPANRLTMCLAAQCTNIGGAASPVSIALEEAICRTFVMK